MTPPTKPRRGRGLVTDGSLDFGPKRAKPPSPSRRAVAGRSDPRARQWSEAVLRVYDAIYPWLRVTNSAAIMCAIERALGEGDGEYAPPPRCVPGCQTCSPKWTSEHQRAYVSALAARPKKKRALGAGDEPCEACRGGRHEACRYPFTVCACRCDSQGQVADRREARRAEMKRPARRGGSR